MAVASTKSEQAHCSAWTIYEMSPLIIFCQLILIMWVQRGRWMWERPPRRLLPRTLPLVAALDRRALIARARRERQSPITPATASIPAMPSALDSLVPASLLFRD